MSLSIAATPNPGSGPSRIRSTAVQATLAVLFTDPMSELIRAIGVDIGGRGEVYVGLGFMLVLSYAMAWMDANGMQYPGQKVLGRVIE